MKNKNKSQRLLFFFDFSNSLKQMKIDLLNQKKTLLKLVVKTLKKMKIFALKILVENQLKYGVIYSPITICPLATGKGQNCTSGRPGGRPANGQIYDR